MLLTKCSLCHLFPFPSSCLGDRYGLINNSENITIKRMHLFYCLLITAFYVTLNCGTFLHLTDVLVQGDFFIYFSFQHIIFCNAKTKVYQMSYKDAII